MNYVDLVALFAVIQFVFFGVLVGRARGYYGVKAPAVSGHEMFERAYRVQMNTLELLVSFLPSLFIAAKFWPQPYVVIAGLVYLVGRIIYWRSYMADPGRRGLGFVLSVAPILALVTGSLVGIIYDIATSG